MKSPGAAPDFWFLKTYLSIHRWQCDTVFVDSNNMSVNWFDVIFLLFQIQSQKIKSIFKNNCSKVVYLKIQ